MTWHHFTPSSDDDQQCSRCEVIVEDAAVDLIEVDCPMPSCTSATNPGPCVMYLDGDEIRCSYCDRSARLAVPDEPDDDVP